VFTEPSLYAPPHAGLPGLTPAADRIIRVPTRFEAADPITAARHDWAVALRSTRSNVDASGPETPPEAALLIGAACATGLPVAAYLPRSNYTHAQEREPNHRNLMVQYRVDTTLRTPSGVTTWIGA
jgi:hypothetical protein